MESKTITVQQIRGTQRGNKKFLPEMIGLKLNKVHRTSTLEDTPAVRGMIWKARHMLRIVDGDALANERPSGKPARPNGQVAPAPFSRNTEFSRAALHMKNMSVRKELERKITDNTQLDQFPALMEAEPRAAAKLASVLLSQAKGRDALTGRDQSTDARGKLAAMTRTLYNKMFSSNQDVAGQAAYALVSNSQSYGKGLDPKADFDHLQRKHAEQFRNGVKAMLKKHHVNFVTSLTAKRIDVDGNDVTVEVHLRVSKSLAFHIDGEKVIIGDSMPMRLDVRDLSIACPYAKERSHLSLKLGDGIDVVVEATAKFVIDNAKLSKKSDVPIVVLGPFLNESRRIPLAAGS